MPKRAFGDSPIMQKYIFRRYNPEANEFGIGVKNNFDKVKELLDL